MTLFRYLEKPEFEGTIGLAIQEAHIGVEWSSEELNLPEEYEDIHMETVEEISDIKVVGVRMFPDGGRLARVEAHLICNFDVFIFKQNYFLVDDDPRLSIIDRDWNKHYMRGEITLSMQSSIMLVLDKSDSEQSKIAVLSVQPIIPDDEREATYYRRYDKLRRASLPSR